MKKVILSIVILIFLTGCGSYNLNYFIMPNDDVFLALIEELDTPQKIGDYMEDNFVFERHPLKAITPYQLYLTEKGDCDDFSTFGVFFANYHGYETYQIKIYYKNYVFNHCLAIYKENGLYTFSGNQYYYSTTYDDFLDIVKYDGQWMYYLYGHIWSKYKVYDYDMKLIKTSYNK